MTTSMSEKRFWAETFPPIAARAAEKHSELTDKLAIYTEELRKFLGLLKGATSPMAMISPRIDHLWHELITCTIVYREYCESSVGRFLDHMPRTEWSKVPEQAVWDFFDHYSARHGDLPDCWFDGIEAQDARLLRQGDVPPAFRWSGYVPQGFRLGPVVI